MNPDLHPDPHSILKTWIRIRMKWMRIGNPVPNNIDKCTRHSNLVSQLTEKELSALRPFSKLSLWLPVVGGGAEARFYLGVRRAHSGAIISYKQAWENSCRS